MQMVMTKFSAIKYLSDVLVDHEDKMLKYLKKKHQVAIDSEV